MPKKKQTNETRADDLVFVIRRGGFGHNTTWKDAANAVRKALDDAEERGRRIARHANINRCD